MRKAKARRMLIQTQDGRRFWLRRERAGWICAPEGVELDHNAACPTALEAITLATGVGPDSPWLRDQAERAREAGL